MPPRKRTTPEAVEQPVPPVAPADDQAQTPAPDPEQPVTPAAPPAPEQPAPPAPPAPEQPEVDEGWEASLAAPDSTPALCRVHFPDPIAPGVTAVACEDGSWIRTGS